MATDQANVALARRWFEEVWNRKDPQVVRELVLPDSICHTDQGDLIGPEPFLAFRALMLTAMPDLQLVVEDTLSDGDRVAVRWLATGTHTGEFQGQPPTGKVVRFGGTTWIRYQGGKMVEGWDCWNMGGLVQQLTGGAT
jgi:steroid delta-isomerase-like uncharacterized protein